MGIREYLFVAAVVMAARARGSFRLIDRGMAEIHDRRDPHQPQGRTFMVLGGVLATVARSVAIAAAGLGATWAIGNSISNFSPGGDHRRLPRHMSHPSNPGTRFTFAVAAERLAKARGPRRTATGQARCNSARGPGGRSDEGRHR